MSIHLVCVCVCGTEGVQCHLCNEGEKRMMEIRRKMDRLVVASISSLLVVAGIIHPAVGGSRSKQDTSMPSADSTCGYQVYINNRKGAPLPRP